MIHAPILCTPRDHWDGYTSLTRLLRQGGAPNPQPSSELSQFYRTVSSSVSYAFRSSFTVTAPFAAVEATDETVPVAASHASTVLPAVFSVTECELPCAPSLKKK